MLFSGSLCEQHPLGELTFISNPITGWRRVASTKASTPCVTLRARSQDAGLCHFEEAAVDCDLRCRTIAAALKLNCTANLDTVVVAGGGG